MSAVSEESSTVDAPTAWLVVITCVYCNATYGSAVTVAGAVLPQIQGDLSVSLDQVSWIVTASIVAGAIGTPPTPWLASRFSRKNMMVACIGLVTVFSTLIGTAGSLGEMIFWRVMQALVAAPIIPLTQSLMMDAFPVRKRGLGLSIWTMGITGGWMLGPTLGTLLVEWGSWRVAFLTFGPLGALGVFLCVVGLPKTAKEKSTGFDWLGFFLLSLGLGSLQLVLNRGQRLDWLDSTEIVVAIGVGVAAMYFFTLHSFSTKRPFIDWSILRDSNLVVGMILLMSYAFISLAPLILIPTMLQDLRGFELVTIGLLLIPRGIAQVSTIAFMSVLIDRIDPRILIGTGLIGFAVGSWLMTNFNLDIGVSSLMIPTLIQGVSMGLISVPILSVAYATIAPHLRTHAATLTGLAYTIASSMGVAVSVVVLTRSSQTSREELAAHVVPTNELLRYPEYSKGWNLDVLENLAAIHGEIGQQATMIGYVNVYWMLAVLCLCVFPLIFLVRKTPERGDVNVLPRMEGDPRRDVGRRTQLSHDR